MSTTCPYAGVLAEDPVQPVRCADVSPMEGKIGYANQVSVVFAGSSERAVIEHSSPIPAQEIEARIL
jgi:hypothetical protein